MHISVNSKNYKNQHSFTRNETLETIKSWIQKNSLCTKSILMKLHTFTKWYENINMIWIYYTVKAFQKQ